MPSTYPTSYIATTAAAVTRNADVLIAGDIITDAAGSGYAEISSIWSISNGQAFILGRGVNSILQRNGGSIGVEIYDSTNVAVKDGSNYYNSVVPVAGTWGVAMNVYNAGAGTPAAYDGTMGSGSLNIGNSSASGGQWNGPVRNVKIFDSELTAAEVADL